MFMHLSVSGVHVSLKCLFVIFQLNLIKVLFFCVWNAYILDFIDLVLKCKNNKLVDKIKSARYR